ncbi:MAG: hypothetical protein AAF682_17845 [Planctomycetota bacterium]
MKRTSVAAAGGLMTLGLASFLLPRDGVSFGPGEGTKLTKTFEGSLEFALDDISVMVNGEEQDIPMDEEPSGTGTYSVVVTDHFKSMSGGRPTELLRSFVEFSGAMESSDGEFSEEGSLDEIEGSTIKFAWDEDEGAYEVTFEEGEGDDEVLAAMSPDMDFRVLLPRGDVSEGDEWDVDGDKLFNILIPGLDMKNAAESGMEIDGESIPQELLDAIDDFLSGVSATCTYKGTSEEDGAEVGEIAFNGEISGALDIDPSAMGEEMGDMGGEAEINLEVDMTMEGTLLWNMSAGHFHSFVLEGEGTIDMHMVMSIPDFDMEFENNASMSIGIEQSASAETAE